VRVAASARAAANSAARNTEGFSFIRIVSNSGFVGNSRESLHY
jgi:hypothetical protein